MKYLLFLTAICFYTATTQAQYNLTIRNPNSTWQTTQGTITQPVIEITPKGAYAQVDMTFIINTFSTKYSNGQQLEAVLLFDLPQGSYIHDSWLWLDQTNIIKADVVEKNRAITIYEGIVNRRRDPSLLIKTGENSYKLNVYPVQKDYARKVKITYFLPLNWRNDKVIAELPIDIFKTSTILPDIPIKINHGNDFAAPELVEDNYNKYLLSTSSTQDVLMLYSNQYNQHSTFNISFSPSNPYMVNLRTYTNKPNEGVYQLTVPPTVFGNNNTRNTVFILDNSGSDKSIYDIESIKQYLKSSLLTNYNTSDSFNVFYVENNKVKQAFPGWANINHTNVDSLMKQLVSVQYNTWNYYEDLLKLSLKFTANKPGNAEAVLISNNRNFTNSQRDVDSLVSRISAYIGGFKNNINVINYSNYSITIFGGKHNANDILYNKLTLTAGGSLFKFNNIQSVYVNGSYQYVYDINAPVALREIAYNSGVSTNSYKIDIDVTNGFTYADYTINSDNKLNLSQPLVITGKYYGMINNGTKIDVQASLPTGLVNQQLTVNTINGGNNTFLHSWTYKYIRDLEKLNNQAYTQEIIDSSINNRVLCNYTAFLAVETGDTINTNFDDNPNITLAVDDEKLFGSINVNCYPNPFTNQVSIELPENTNMVEIYDMMGRKVFSIKTETDQKKIIWNGTDNNNRVLPSGVYMVIATTADKRYTTKLMKQ